uniref:Uncharacterized protein n=1 Tax=Anopheles dirus TaxID=7168 RepID=A0A182N4S5_9DIPT
MKHLTLALLVVVGATTLLLPGVSTFQPAVPYFDQRLSAGPLSRTEMAYLKRLVEEQDDLQEVTTEADAGDGSDAWDNSCVSEAVNPGGFSNEESSEGAPTAV